MKIYIKSKLRQLTLWMFRKFCPDHIKHLDELFTLLAKRHKNILYVKDEMILDQHIKNKTIIASGNVVIMGSVLEKVHINYLGFGFEDELIDITNCTMSGSGDYYLFEITGSE